MTLKANKLFIAGLLIVSTAVIVGCADSSDEGTQTGEATEQVALDAKRALDRAADSLAAAVADSIEMAAAVEPEPEPEPEIAEDMPRHGSLEVEYGTYTVQMGSYDSRELAQPFMDKLAAEGREPYLLDELVEINGEERMIYRLRFGKFSSKDEAHNRGSEVALLHELDYWVDNYKF